MLYGLAKFVFTIYFFFINKITLKGTENIPESGGAVLCSNHINWLDPILIGICIKRKIYFMAKAECFRNKLFAFIMKGINAFPVKRGTADISAIKKSFSIIRGGDILGIFPEGTRSRTGRLLPAEPGASVIAIKTHAPIIPVRVQGSYLIGGHLRLTIGKPISFEEYSGRKLSSQEINNISQQIMKEISKLD